MIIVKIGGGKTVNQTAIAQDIAQLTEPVILVHGASETRDEIAKQMGFPTKTITSPSGISSVYTDTQAMDIFLMAYAGLVNKRLVETLLKAGVNAIGLTGADASIWKAKRKEVVYSVEHGKTKLLKDNMTGTVQEINTKFLQQLLDTGYVPVLCPPAISFNNELVNTDNDMATAVMGAQLKAKAIVYLFEETGLLRDFNDKTSIIKSVSLAEMQSVFGSAKGRMKKKLMGAEYALKNGVSHVYFADGRITNPVQNALAGNGTIMYS